jgi:hypothetical protein
MWRFIGATLGTVALTGFMGVSVGVGYYLFKVADNEKD